jgi:alkylated DNA repair dioxygenase AlkB
MNAKKSFAGTADFFQAAPAMPLGFVYRTELIPAEYEQELLVQFANLPFEPFQFHGYEGKRRAISYGWEYDFNQREFREAEALPPFLSVAREAAAALAGLVPSDLQHALLLQYPPGAGIGWHKDKPHFGDVVGLSLLSSCTLRFRRTIGAAWERASIAAEPRSAYLLRGPSRREWEHSIPAVEHQRYSITFRTLATGGATSIKQRSNSNRSPGTASARSVRCTSCNKKRSVK